MLNPIPIPPIPLSSHPIPSHLSYIPYLLFPSYLSIPYHVSRTLQYKSPSSLWSLLFAIFPFFDIYLDNEMCNLFCVILSFFTISLNVSKCKQCVHYIPCFTYIPLKLYIFFLKCLFCLFIPTQPYFRVLVKVMNISCRP